jgi:hypothetical protein
MKFNRLSFDYFAPDRTMYSIEIGFGCGIVIGKTPDRTKYCWLGKYWQKELVKRVNDCSIQDWREIYYKENGSCEAWGVKLILDGKILFSSCGLSDFPKNWDNFRSVIDPCLRFLKLDEDNDEDEPLKRERKTENGNKGKPRQ